jgi:hypothetical protein
MMNSEDRATELEVWSTQVNSSVVRVPGRRFPGVVIQGDSLSILFDLSMDLVDGFSKTADSELTSAAEELAEKLFAHVKSYESVLEARGVALPYVRDPKRVPKPRNFDEGAG